MSPAVTVRSPLCFSSIACISASFFKYRLELPQVPRGPPPEHRRQDGGEERPRTAGAHRELVGEPRAPADGLESASAPYRDGPAPRLEGRPAVPLDPDDLGDGRRAAAREPHDLPGTRPGAEAPRRLVAHLLHAGAPEGVVLVLAGEGEHLPDRSPDGNPLDDPQDAAGILRVDRGVHREGGACLLYGLHGSLLLLDPSTGRVCGEG